MASLGCLFAAMVAQLRAREVMLPLLTLPLWIPFIVAGGQAVQVMMAERSYGQALWLRIDSTFSWCSPPSPLVSCWTNESISGGARVCRVMLAAAAFIFLFARPTRCKTGARIFYLHVSPPSPRS